MNSYTSEYCLPFNSPQHGNWNSRACQRYTALRFLIISINGHCYDTVDIESHSDDLSIFSIAPKCDGI
jgi:hypothetical protein